MTEGMTVSSALSVSIAAGGSMADCRQLPDLSAATLRCLPTEEASSDKPSQTERQRPPLINHKKKL
jgi:hypothetical protein|eukprot:COSAG06_NODE_150_length_22019_cov_17.221031_8_plen_66_part_00